MCLRLHRKRNGEVSFEHQKPNFVQFWLWFQKVLDYQAVYLTTEPVEKFLTFFTVYKNMIFLQT